VPGITNAIAVQAGFTHTLVLRDDGTVWTFGNNGSGQLGHSTGVVSTPTPTQVPGLDDVVQIAAGSAVSYVLRANGEVYAFGANDQGQLGLGVADTTAHATPMPVPAVSNAIAVAASNTTAYALLADGTLLAWGRNHAGQAGVASEATTVLAPTPVLRLAADGSTSPLDGVVGVAGDGFVGAALHSDGSVLAWGLGSLGQLGQGVLPDGARDLENRRAASPVAVSDADRALFVIQEIEVGAGGPTLALSRDGNLFGWGWSFQGSLGLEGAINAWAYSSPVLVMAAP
jgi:alpha-tubulin suppressor-like RCC1 family protein